VASEVPTSPGQAVAGVVENVVNPFQDFVDPAGRRQVEVPQLWEIAGVIASTDPDGVWSCKAVFKVGGAKISMFDLRRREKWAKAEFSWDPDTGECTMTVTPEGDDVETVAFLLTQ
jgi:hypothetical protein